MTWYQEGTVTVTQGSATITGAGTDWQDQAQGWQVQIDGETPLGEIDAVLSPTEIRLRNPVTRASATGLAYRITPTQGLNQALRAELAEVLSAVNTARNAIQSFEQTYTPQSLLTDLLTVDGADSGLDADLFRGRDDAFYRNADNLISGRVQEARLSGSYDISITGDAATATNATQLAGELPAFYRNASNMNAGILPVDQLIAHFASSAASSGYQRLPSGLILQWGFASGAAGPLSVTFPIAFPAAPLAIYATMEGIPPVGQLINAYVISGTLTQTGASFNRLFVNDGGTTGNTSSGFYWLVLGH